jgi:hypothetical protein
MTSLNFARLSEFRSPNVFNPWGEDDPTDAYAHGSAMRVARLAQHFECEPKFLLVGEAPGYQGCHFSGVPFTNEKLLLEGRIPRVKANMRITQRELPWSEPSATIMWRTLHELQIASSTVMWNAFAWHPYKPGAPMTNRAPSTNELLNGNDVLQAVTHYFRGVDIIAVGRVAEKTLRWLGVDIKGAVRHPSMGGAKAFRDGMAALVQKREGVTSCA